jgi:hypothetical protein
MIYEGDINYLVALQELGVPIRITDKGFTLGGDEDE